MHIFCSRCTDFQLAFKAMHILLSCRTCHFIHSLVQFHFNFLLCSNPACLYVSVFKLQWKKPTLFRHMLSLLSKQ